MTKMDKVLTLLLLAMPAICFGQGKPPRIFGIGGGTQIKNHHMILKEGATNQFKLDCQVEEGASPEPTITWYKNGQKIQDVQGISIRDPKEIEFTDPIIDWHQGYYHCQAENSLGLAKSEVIHLSPAAPQFQDWTSVPFLKTEPEVEIMEEGKSVEFKCVAEGAPRPKIEWTFNGNILENFTAQEKLTIPSIDPSHIGTYACNASNVAGYIYKVVYLNILTQPPIFTETPRNGSIVSIGQEAILRCAVKGYPNPEIQWLFEGKELLNDSNYLISSRGDLTIKKVMAQMEGNYECQATNAHDSRSKFAYLRVVDKTTITDGPNDVEVRVRENVRFNCTVVWDPNFELDFYWSKENQRLRVDNERITIDPHERFLTIRNLNFGDAGTYTCVAMTGTSTDADSGTLKVLGIPPTLITGPTARTVPEDTDIEILCSVSGLPLPKFTWFKGTERLIEDKERITVNQETGTLTILNAFQNDSAKYICKADNSYGEPVIASAFIDVTMRSKVLSAPQHALLKLGQDVTFDCEVQVDARLKKTVQVEWYFNDNKLDIQIMSDEPVEYEDNQDEAVGNDTKYSMVGNNSLRINSPTIDDLGTYRCQVITGVEPPFVLEAGLYSEADQGWIYIVIIAIICFLILLLLIMCIVCVRKRSRRKGRYGVKDVADGKRKNRSDIQYSIDDDTESLHKELEGETPIIKPSSNHRRNGNLDHNGDLKGSENSLLNMTDEDLWLRKGMDEDGSFRQVYIKE